MPLLYAVNEFSPEHPIHTVHAKTADEYKICIKYLSSWVEMGRFSSGLWYFDTETQAKAAQRYFIKAEMKKLKETYMRETEKYNNRTEVLLKAEEKLDGVKPIVAISEQEAS